MLECLLLPEMGKDPTPTGTHEVVNEDQAPYSTTSPNGPSKPEKAMYDCNQTKSLLFLSVISSSHRHVHAHSCAHVSVSEVRWPLAFYFFEFPVYSFTFPANNCAFANKEIVLFLT